MLPDLLFSMKPAAVSAVVSILAAPVSCQGYVQVPLQRVGSHTPRYTAHQLLGNDVEPLSFTGIRYFATYSVGSPPQNQTGILDTGSSDLFTFSSQAWPGGYDPSKSSTYQWVNDNFHDAYGTGSEQVSGTWAKDTVLLGEVAVPDYPFAYLNQTQPQDFSLNRGIFGIGPKTAEGASPQYDTYIERLQQAGAISAQAFSLYMTDDNSTASLLYGGIDTAKYQGQLYTTPFSSQQKWSSFYYAVDFEILGEKLQTGLLDSGTPQVLIPQNLSDKLAAQYGAIWNDEEQSYIRTSAPDPNLPDLSLKIAGVDIKIPAKDMYTYYEGVYLFAISRALDEGDFSLIILGDPLLRQLYLVYDLDHSEIAFAPVKITDESNIKPIGQSIPGATPAPGY